jgi:hypothetical protein
MIVQVSELRYGSFQVNVYVDFTFINLAFLFTNRKEQSIHCEEPCGRDRRASKSKFKQPKLLNIFFSPLTSYVFLNHSFIPFAADRCYVISICPELTAPTIAPSTSLLKSDLRYFTVICT